MSEPTAIGGIGGYPLGLTVECARCRRKVDSYHVESDLIAETYAFDVWCHGRLETRTLSAADVLGGKPLTFFQRSP